MRAHDVGAMLAVIHGRLVYIYQMANGSCQQGINPVMHHHGFGAADTEGSDDLDHCLVHSARAAGDQVLHEQLIQTGAVRVSTDVGEE